MVFKTKKGTELPLLDMRGKPYLQVAHRLVWMREEHPNWSIETELCFVDNTQARAKATIRDETGRILATAHKTENQKGFADFVEKAETGAVGRALALTGYATQFCADELDEGERIVDSPIAPAQRPSVQNNTSNPQVHSCGNKMMTSLRNPNEWYCGRCKMTLPKSLSA